MHLVLVLEGKVMAAVPIQRQILHNQEYIANLKHKLADDHAEQIELSPEAPVFFLEGVGSCINGFESLLSRCGGKAVDDLLTEVMHPSRVKRYKE